MSEKPFLTGVSLTQRERKIVEKENQRRGIYNFSGTLRHIINEWAELTGNKLDEEEKANGHDPQ